MASISREESGEIEMCVGVKHNTNNSLDNEQINKEQNELYSESDAFFRK